jgi:ABC-2 type transport system ATP-binding protein
MTIQVQQLQKRYGAREALAGVDLAIERGGVVGLLGPNGAGKTTLVEILEGLRTPTSGRVVVLGCDPAREAARLRERLGVQLQSTMLPAELTARETIDLFGAFYARRRATAEVLDAIGLTDHAGALVRQLSGGQRQRLALGIALVHDPELLVLDEPTAGLDPVARRGLHDVIRAQHRRGCTVILTTHYIEEAEALCDRVVVLRRGRVVADDTPFALLSRAAGQSTLWLQVAGPFEPAALERAGCDYLGLEGEHHRFATTNPAAVIVALGELLRAHPVQLTDLRLKRPTLEDVYLELVEEPAETGGPASSASAVGEGGGR